MNAYVARKLAEFAASILILVPCVLLLAWETAPMQHFYGRCCWPAAEFFWRHLSMRTAVRNSGLGDV